MLKSISDFLPFGREKGSVIDYPDPSKGEMLLEVRDIVKEFPGVWRKQILDNVNFDLRAGEVHTILGENGAGKTVLANIVSGFYSKTSGKILVREEEVDIRSPRDAIDLGIGMVHQELTLAKRFSVAENIALALKEPGYSLPLSRVEERIRDLSENYGMRVDPTQRVDRLSAGEQQRVEILKALYFEPDILIMDEPASMLTPQETEDLFKIVEELLEGNKGIMFITHKIEEALEISDRISVLRLGKLVDETRPEEVDPDKLVDMMISKEVPPRPERKSGSVGEVILDLNQLRVSGDDGLPAVKGVSLQVKEGEILGVAGVAGNGQKELVECITGMRKAEGGEVRIMGEDMTNASPRRIIEKGVSYIPEDRREVGISEGLTAAENAALKCYRREPYCKYGNLDHSNLTEMADELISEHEAIVPDLWNTESRILSGGNIQRIILARELFENPQLLVAVHPTYGLDPRGARYTHKQFLNKRDEGAGILLVSENLDEILELSDRIDVMYEGEIVFSVDSADAKKEEIGRKMVGGRKGFEGVG
ncbi:MAG: ABC transporter ATP-binding protein [Candidatus Hadarchaeota archaeon]